MSVAIYILSFCLCDLRMEFMGALQLPLKLNAVVATVRNTLIAIVKNIGLKKIDNQSFIVY